MESNRFIQLKFALNELREHLLPHTFDPTGFYEDKAISTKAIAYRVLAHAEVESFFEDRTLELVMLAQTAWFQNQHASKVILALVTFSGQNGEVPPDSLEAPSENQKKSWQSKIDINQRLTSIISKFNTLVTKNNHGIKEKNLLSLLIPIGIDHTKLDSVFLADINSFGIQRGSAAHSSRKSQVQQAIDPMIEFKNVENLIPGIQSIDNLIEKLKLDINVVT